MKIPWPLFLAWKQLFPSRYKVSFFSFLAVVGVALGVNVMIVVVAFMKGFQEKFRTDIIDAQGHARAVSLNHTREWRDLTTELLARSQVLAATPYLQGPLLAQKNEYNSVPMAIGVDLSAGPSVLPLGKFLQNGQLKMEARHAVDLTPVPNLDVIGEEVVFISQYVANKLGVGDRRPYF